MPSGGKPGNRGGNGGKRVVTGGRDWIRSLTDDPARRQAFTDALDAALTGPDPEVAVAAYLKAFEHGYGRPPQALDVRTQAVGAVEYIVTFPGSAASGTAALADISSPDVSLDGAD